LAKIKKENKFIETTAHRNSGKNCLRKEFITHYHYSDCKYFFFVRQSLLGKDSIPHFPNIEVVRFGSPFPSSYSSTQRSSSRIGGSLGLSLDSNWPRNANAFEIRGKHHPLE
jgi:hypothetical protein